MTQTRLRDAMEGVRALYAKDHRLEAKVTLEDVKYDAATNRAVPVFDIDAGPRIRLRAIGAKISESSLGHFVPIFEEHSVDADLLTEGSHNLRDYLQSKGYFDAEVEFKQQNVIQDQATIDYLVNLGDTAQAGVRRYPGKPLLPRPPTSGNACFCAPRPGCSFRMAASAPTCCGATRIRSSTCTNPTDFAT